MQLTIVSSGSQLLLKRFLFRFKSKNKLILEISKVGRLKKNFCLLEKEIILLNRSLFPNLCSNRVVNRKSLVKCQNIFLLKKKQITIFWPPDIKGLKLRRAAFKMLFSQGVRGSSFKRPPIVCAKTVSNLLRESTQTIVYVTQNFFKTT